MTGQPDYHRYLESAKQAEFADRLRAQGFSVEAGQRVGDLQFDLVARKGAQAIAYEFKAGRSPKNGHDRMERLQRAAKQAGYEFHIVVVNPPPRVSVEVENLAARLRDYMRNDRFPLELDQLAPHTRISGVRDLEIAEIYIGQGEIWVAGTGAVEVELQSGSTDDGFESGDAFPFHFKAVLAADGSLKEVEQLSVDTSSFND